MPTEALVSPLPSELTTPPVTKICLVMHDPCERNIALGQKRALETVHSENSRLARGPGEFSTRSDEWRTNARYPGNSCLGLHSTVSTARHKGAQMNGRIAGFLRSATRHCVPGRRTLDKRAIIFRSVDAHRRLVDEANADAEAVFERAQLL